jgi:hypothetical protein
MKRIQYVLVVFSITGLLFIVSCKKNSDNTNSLYIPSSADTTSTATLLELQQGRALYISNCNSCHNLYSPDDYTVLQWKSILPNMTPRTNMTASEILLVTKYVSRGKQ